MIITEFISIFVEILLYFLVSLICLFIGRKVYDWITPYDLNYQTAEGTTLQSEYPRPVFTWPSVSSSMPLFPGR